MLPIPAEAITLLGSFALSGLMSLWAKSITAKKQFNSDMLAAATQHTKAVDAARDYGASNKGFSFTRRTLAISAFFAVIVWPKIVPVLFPEVPVTLGWTQWNPGFLFFGGSEQTVWQTAKGLVITPLDTHIVTAIAGLYFGASAAKVR